MASITGDQGIAKPLASYAAGRVIQISPNHQLLYISGTTARQSNGNIPPFGVSYDENLLSISTNEASPQYKWLSAAAIQTDIILSKVASVIDELSGGKHGLEALVELTIFVKDLERDYGAINEVYNERVGALFASKALSLPARTCVQVRAMPPDERTLVEMKGVAALQTTA